MAFNTGGTLSTKMIKLVGDLDQQATLANIQKAIPNIEKELKSSGTKIKIDIEVFGKIEDIKKDISALQNKLNSSSDIKDIKLGVSLKDTTIKDINEQIKKVQEKVNGSKTANSLKLDVDFNFKGSASKVKEEMKEIKDFIDRFSAELQGKKIVDLESDAKGVKKDSNIMKDAIKDLGKGTEDVGSRIEAQMREMTGATGKFAVTFKQDVNGAIEGATGTISNADGTVQKFTYALGENSTALDLQKRSTKEVGDQQERLATEMKKVEDAQRKLNDAIAKSPSGQNQDLIEQAKNHLQVARSMEEQGRVTDAGVNSLKALNESISQINNNTKNFRLAEEFKQLKGEAESAIDKFKQFGGSSEDVEKFKTSVNNMAVGSTDDMKALKKEVEEATKAVQNAGKSLDAEFSKISASSGKSQFLKAVDESDINSLKRYVEQLYDGQVKTIQMTDAQDKMGNAVTRIKANLEGQAGELKSYTVDVQKGFEGTDRAVRQTSESTKLLSNDSKGLSGIFQNVVGRITQYISAMALVQTAIRGVKGSIQEILAINARMTELSRVASPWINTNIVLQKSIALSKDLGASVNDVVGSVADMARTFGDFNEEQLIAITRTATIMSNVSDMELGTSAETLVATMKAFNITAEDSISIVDALNEVDKTYAISTQQLAEGLKRTGATAKTFGRHTMPTLVAI